MNCCSGSVGTSKRRNVSLVLTKRLMSPITIVSQRLTSKENNKTE
jgi:hypothetical protein